MANIVDRLISACTYFTFGIFGVICILFAYVSKKSISNFSLFNIYQSCIIGIILAIIGMSYDFLLKLGVIISFLGKILKAFDIFFNGTPIYFGYTISGLLVTIFILYLIIFTLLGRKPYIPVISSAINEYTRG